MRRTVLFFLRLQLLVKRMLASDILICARVLSSYTFMLFTRSKVPLSDNNLSVPIKLVLMSLLKRDNKNNRIKHDNRIIKMKMINSYPATFDKIKKKCSN